MRYVQAPCIQYTQSPSGSFAAAGFLLKGIAVHTFLDGGVVLVGADVDHIQSAIVFAAHIVAALLNGAVNVGVLLTIHHDERSSFLQYFLRSGAMFVPAGIVIVCT